MKTIEDVEDSILYLKADQELRGLKSEADKELYRKWVLPMFHLNNRPIGKSFKDSEEK